MKENVLPGSEGDCVDSVVERVGLGTGMDAHAAEISTKRRLHLAANYRVERLAPPA
jgi:hypothetical protein